MRKPLFLMTGEPVPTADHAVSQEPGKPLPFPASLDGISTLLVRMCPAPSSLSAHCRETLQSIMAVSLAHPEIVFCCLCPDDSTKKNMLFQYNMWYEPDHPGEGE